ncbi:MAG: hypothetical protein ABI305_06965 [Tepidiformaceae bacterium]
MTTPLTKQNIFPEWWASAAPFALVGVACVVVGGLVSAIAASSPSENSSWAVAYLVLVAGVAQIALGVGQSRLASTPPSRQVLLAEFLTWNLGNAAVIAGQLLGFQAAVDAGGVLLVISLALLFRGVRGALPAVRGSIWTLYVYRAVLLIILVSIPIGLVIGHVKAS